MIISLITGLLIGAAAVVFALQNIFTVTVTFLGWELTASLAVLIILAVVVGALITALLTIPGAIKNSFVISVLKKENKKLHEEHNASLKQQNATIASTETAHSTVN